MGLENAGFRVAAGVEIDAQISETYKKNHPEVALLRRDLRQVTGREILERCGIKQVALVAGCPPCQGFSRLTYKNKCEDPRNGLVLEMARIVRELDPSMVMMENVPGLLLRGKSILDKFDEILRSLGYVTRYDILQLADYGVPQFRRRLVFLAGKGFAIAFPTRTHSRQGDREIGLKPWPDLRSVLRGSVRPLTLSEAFRKGGPQKFNWHIVRSLNETTKKRLKALRPGVSRGSLPVSLRPHCHQGTDQGYENVYGRMAWNQTPPTITSGCTTVCMGRFGHPSQLRTISLREAASIQTFPRGYSFATNLMHTACTAVGNALPPRFGEVAGRRCIAALEGQGGRLH